MSLHTETIRNTAVLLLLPSVVAFGDQQTDVRADLPGAYAARECATARFPVELPLLDSVLDSATLAADLKSAAMPRRVVFGLRLGALATEPQVRLLEGKIPGAVADRVVAAVQATLREITSDRAWAFRLVVEGEHGKEMRLERSQVCGAFPGSIRREMRIATMSAEELEDFRREVQEDQRRRRSMLHRLLVDVRGRVLAVELVSSSGDGQTDADATGALRKLSFSPTKLDGAPVSAWVELRGDFEAQMR